MHIIMTEQEVFTKLEEVFVAVFDDPSIRLTRETTADDIDDWDSIEHIHLISAVEEAFGMKFAMREVSGMKNVGEMADILRTRGH